MRILFDQGAQVPSGVIRPDTDRHLPQLDPVRINGYLWPRVAHSAKEAAKWRS